MKQKSNQFDQTNTHLDYLTTTTTTTKTKKRDKNNKIQQKKLKKLLISYANQNVDLDEIQPDDGYENGLTHSDKSNNMTDLKKKKIKTASKLSAQISQSQNQEQAMKLKNKKKKKKQEESANHTTKSPDPKACFRLKNLPPTVNYAMLKNTIPMAAHFRIFKKGGTRNAFVICSNSVDCAEAIKAVQDLELDGYKVSVSIPSSSDKPNQSAPSENMKLPSRDDKKSLTISNLPFSITKAELEDEFPTAHNIRMNVNKDGRFKGSCLLEFESEDDARIVFEVCANKSVGGRLVYAKYGCCFKLNENNAQSVHQPRAFGLLLKNTPSEITNNQIQDLFPKADLLSISSFANTNSTTRTVALRFVNKSKRSMAVKLFRNQEVLGHNFIIRSWDPLRKSRRRYAERQIAKTTMAPSSSETEKPKTLKHKFKHHPTKQQFNENSSQPDDATKFVHRKHKHVQSGNKHQLFNDNATDLVSKKRKRRESEHDRDNSTNYVVQHHKKHKHKHLDSTISSVKHDSTEFAPKKPKHIDPESNQDNPLNQATQHHKKHKYERHGNKLPSPKHHKFDHDSVQSIHKKPKHAETVSSSVMPKPSHHIFYDDSD